MWLFHRSRLGEGVREAAPPSLLGMGSASDKQVFTKHLPCTQHWCSGKFKTTAEDVSPLGTLSLVGEGVLSHSLSQNRVLSGSLSEGPARCYGYKGEEEDTGPPSVRLRVGDAELLGNSAGRGKVKVQWDSYSCWVTTPDTVRSLSLNSKLLEECCLSFAFTLFLLCCCHFFMAF